MMLILESLAVAGFIQGIFLFLFLCISRKGSRRANFFLGILILALSVNVIHPYIISNLMKDFIYDREPVEPFILLIGPCIYFYINAFFKHNKIKFIAILPHFIPFVLIFSLLIISRFQAFFIIDLPSAITKPFWVAAVIHICFYFLLAGGRLHRSLILIKQEFSDLKKRDLNWVRLFMAMILFFIMITVLTVFFQYHFMNQFPAGKIIGLILSLIIYAMGYSALIQPELFFHNNHVPENQLRDDEIVKEKYSTSGLSDAEAQSIKNNLLSYMDKSRPYLEPEINLPGLALQLKINRNSLSQVINDKLGQNFYDFINSYRVEEMKKLLLDSETKSWKIIAVAFEAGFNSKAAANAVFKKQTGITPGEYQKKHMSELTR